MITPTTNDVLVDCWIYDITHQQQKHQQQLQQQKQQQTYDIYQLENFTVNINNNNINNNINTCCNKNDVINSCFGRFKLWSGNKILHVILCTIIRHKIVMKSIIQQQHHERQQQVQQQYHQEENNDRQSQQQQQQKPLQNQNQYQKQYQQLIVNEILFKKIVLQHHIRFLINDNCSLSLINTTPSSPPTTLMLSSSRNDNDYDYDINDDYDYYCNKEWKWKILNSKEIICIILEHLVNEYFTSHQHTTNVTPDLEVVGINKNTNAPSTCNDYANTTSDVIDSLASTATIQQKQQQQQQAQPDICSRYCAVKLRKRKRANHDVYYHTTSKNTRIVDTSSYLTEIDSNNVMVPTLQILVESLQENSIENKKNKLDQTTKLSIDSVLMGYESDDITDSIASDVYGNSFSSNTNMISNDQCSAQCQETKEQSYNDDSHTHEVCKWSRDIHAGLKVIVVYTHNDKCISISSTKSKSNSKKKCLRQNSSIDSLAMNDETLSKHINKSLCINSEGYEVEASLLLSAAKYVTIPKKQDVLIIGQNVKYCFHHNSTWPGNTYFIQVTTNFFQNYNNITEMNETTTATTNDNCKIKVKLDTIANEVIEEIYRVGGTFLSKSVIDTDVLTGNSATSTSTITNTKLEMKDEYDKLSDSSAGSNCWQIVESQIEIAKLISKFMLKVVQHNQQKQQLQQQQRQIYALTTKQNAQIPWQPQNQDVQIDKLQSTAGGTSLATVINAAASCVCNLSVIVDGIYISSPHQLDSTTTTTTTNECTDSSKYDETQQEPHNELAVWEVNSNSTSHITSLYIEDNEVVVVDPVRIDVEPGPELVHKFRELQEVCARIRINDPSVTCVDIDADFTTDMISFLGKTLVDTLVENESIQLITAMGLETIKFDVKHLHCKDEPYRSLFDYIERSRVLDVMFLNGCNFTNAHVSEALVHTVSYSYSLRYLTICNISLPITAIDFLLKTTNALEIIEFDTCSIVGSSSHTTNCAQYTQPDTNIPKRNCTLKKVSFKGAETFNDSFLIPVLLLMHSCDKLEKISLVKDKDSVCNTQVDCCKQVSLLGWIGLADVIRHGTNISHLSFSNWTFASNELNPVIDAIRNRSNADNMKNQFHISFASACHICFEAAETIKALFSTLRNNSSDYYHSSRTGCASTIYIGNGCKFWKPTTSIVQFLFNNPFNSINDLRLRSIGNNAIEGIIRKVLFSSKLKHLDLGPICFTDRRRLRILIHYLPLFTNLQELTVHVNGADDAIYSMKNEWMDAFKRNGSILKAHFPVMEYQVDDAEEIVVADGMIQSTFWTENEMNMLHMYWERNKTAILNDGLAKQPTYIVPLMASHVLDCTYGLSYIFRGLLAMGEYEKCTNHFNDTLPVSTDPLFTMNNEEVYCDENLLTKCNIEDRATTTHSQTNDKNDRQCTNISKRQYVTRTRRTIQNPDDFFVRYSNTDL